MLGIHINVAVAWQHACAGDWANYAADYSRRPKTRPPTTLPTTVLDSYSKSWNI